MKNLAYYQAQYLAHRRRFIALGLKPMKLAAMYSACFEYPIEVPIFVSKNE
jgi:hypothetical protein